jgi:hypothetical protein
MVLPSGQNLTLSLLATIIADVVPFHTYAPYPDLLPFFKGILEDVVCEGVQHCLQLCLSHLNCVIMTTFSEKSHKGPSQGSGVGHSSCFGNSLVKMGV